MPSVSCLERTGLLLGETAGKETDNGRDQDGCDRTRPHTRRNIFNFMIRDFAGICNGMIRTVRCVEQSGIDAVVQEFLQLGPQTVDLSLRGFGCNFNVILDAFTAHVQTPSSVSGQIRSGLILFRS